MSACWCEQAEPAGALDRLSAGVGIQLRVDVALVGADGVRGDAELVGDLPRLEVAGQVPAPRAARHRSSGSSSGGAIVLSRGAGEQASRSSTRSVALGVVDRGAARGAQRTSTSANEQHAFRLGELERALSDASTALIRRYPVAPRRRTAAPRSPQMPGQRLAPSRRSPPASSSDGLLGSAPRRARRPRRRCGSRAVTRLLRSSRASSARTSGVSPSRTRARSARLRVRRERMRAHQAPLQALASRATTGRRRPVPCPKRTRPRVCLTEAPRAPAPRRQRGRGSRSLEPPLRLREGGRARPAWSPRPERRSARSWCPAASVGQRCRLLDRRATDVAGRPVSVARSARNERHRRYRLWVLDPARGLDRLLQMGSRLGRAGGDENSATPRSTAPRTVGLGTAQSAPGWASNAASTDRVRAGGKASRSPRAHASRSLRSRPALKSNAGRRSASTVAARRSALAIWRRLLIQRVGDAESWRRRVRAPGPRPRVRRKGGHQRAELGAAAVERSVPSWCREQARRVGLDRRSALYMCASCVACAGVR